MEDHWRAGYRDATETLAHPEIMVLPMNPDGLEVYDFITPRGARDGSAQPKKDPK